MAVLTLYGSAVADATLTTACDMAAVSGGVEVGKQTTFSGTGNFAEVWSKGNASSPVVSAIPATPNGNGWVYTPGAGTFAAANWSASVTVAVFVNNAGVYTIRFFKYSAGVYSSIGNLTFTPTATAKTTYAVSAVSMPATTFTATDLLYVDYWYQDNTGAGGDNCTIYESTTSTAGVASDMQITTANFTPAATGPLVKPRFIGRALGATIIPEPVKQPLPYIGRALGATIVYEKRTFVPRALGGVYIPDDPALLWVPRAIASTTQIPSGVTLSSTLAGVGTLSETFTLATSLTDTIPGVGTLSATLSVNLALAVEFDGVGTLSETLTLATSLTSTLAGVGTLSETFTLATSLSVTDAGIGTLTPTLSANLTLPSVTLAGTGTLAGSLFAVSQPLPYIGRALGSTIIYENRTFVPRALSGVYIPDTILPVPRALLSTIQATVGLGGTLAGIGTLSETFSLATALSTTLAGVGTLSPTLSTTGGVSLSVTFAGVGTLSETLSLTTALSTTLPGIGTLTPTLSANLTLASVTTPGVGTLAATMSAQVILSTSLVGAGTLSGVYALRVALSLTFAGAGTLAGAITIPVTVFLSATCVTRDMQAITTTRDMQAIAFTRDEKMGALTRDENATVTTRDMQATAKTRS